jgi:hypothetical protein
MKFTPQYDFTITRKQSQILLTPKTHRAEDWGKAYLFNTPKLGEAFIIASGDFGKVANALPDANLNVKKED